MYKLLAVILIGNLHSEMTQFKHAVTLFLAILSLTLFQCTSDDVSFDKKEFQGNWVISEVIYDGVLQDEWVGAKVYFDQLNQGGGTYSLTNTPYDSIWRSDGIWSTTDKASTFLRDNDVLVEYWFDNNNICF